MIRMQRFFFGQLLRGTTHKLNNILAVIHGFSSLLLMNESRDASEAENLEQMKSAAKRASILGEQILAAGGCSQVTVTEVNTDGLVSGLESSMRKPFEERQIRLEIVRDPELSNISTDASRLRDILIGLLENAAEAAAETGGTARISFRPSSSESSRLEIMVENTGPSIPDMAAIYQPFFSTKQGDHLGIGLTVVAVLCGQLDILLAGASSEGHTTFILSVPVA